MSESRMPRPTQSPRISPAPMHTLLMDLHRFQTAEAEVRIEYPWADRFVMGLPLVPWQRELKWDRQQCERFITSAWTGVHLGTYILTEAELENRPDVQYQYLANSVIDGQQRLHALESYFTDQLPVPDLAGVPTRWSELGKIEQRWFSNRVFERGVVPLAEESSLRAQYDALNFGGTPHLESERALPRVVVSVSP